MEYCSLAELKNHLDITEDTDDALLTSAIAAAQEAVNNYCGVAFGVETNTTEYFNYSLSCTNDAKYLILARKRLAEIDTVLVGTNNVTGMVLTKGNPIHTIVLPRSSGYSFASIGEVDVEEGVAITGKWGYSTDVPAAVKQATILWAAFLYQMKDASPDGTIATSTDGTTLQTGGKPITALAILAPYTMGW